MSSSGGRRRATASPSWPPAVPVVLHLVAVLVLATGWVALVRGAIGFGVDIRNGTHADWRGLALTSVAAATCLFLALLLLRRMATVTGIISAYQPKRARRRR